MTDTFLTPEELDSNNSIENNNNNLQNNSEESTKNENVEKQKPKHFPGLFDLTPEEIELRRQEEDRELWERINEEERDPNNSDRKSEVDKNISDANKDQDKNSDSKKKIRVSKDSGTKLASLRRSKSQKQLKYNRLVKEMRSLKADQKRGYRIVENKDGQKVHIPIDSTEDLILSLQISERDRERFNLRYEIRDIDQDIKSLANKKLSNSKLEKERARMSEQQHNLVKRIMGELDKASKNGTSARVAEIRSQATNGSKDIAAALLKSFLSDNVQTVFKKLSKSDELEKNVMERVLDKLNSVQS